MKIILTLLVFGSCQSASGQNIHSPTGFVTPQYSYNSGVPVANGFICTFASGTTTPLATYTTPNDPIANPIRVPLDADGRANIYLQGALYTIKLYGPGSVNTCNGSAVGSLIWSVDEIRDLAQLFAAALHLDNVRVCSRYPGSNASAKIVACIADLPGTGGIASVQGLEGAQAWTACPFTGVTKPVSVLLGAGTTIVSAACTVPSSVALSLPQGAILSINTGLTLTIGGAFDATISNHFAGAGTISFVGSPNKVLYPQWWGALGDGTTDDSSAINKALAVTHLAHGILDFPPVADGYGVASTVLYTGDLTHSIEMRGHASISGAGSQIKWIGTAGAGPVVDLYGATHFVMRDMSIDNNSLVTTALQMRGDNGSGKPSMDLSFYNLIVYAGAAGAIGVQLGTNSSQMDGVAFHQPYIASDLGARAFNASPVAANSKNIQIYGGQITGFDYAIYANNAPASKFSIYDTEILGSRIADVRWGAGFLNMSGVAVENIGPTSRIVTGGSQNNQCGVAIRDSYFDLIADTNDYVIDLNGCSLLLENNRFVNGRTSTSVPRVRLSLTGTTTTSNSLISHNNWYANAQSTAPLDHFSTPASIFDPAGILFETPYSTYVNAESFGDTGNTPGNLTLFSRLAAWRLGSPSQAGLSSFQGHPVSIRVLGRTTADAVAEFWADGGYDAADKYSITVTTTGTLVIKQNTTTIATILANGTILQAGSVFASLGTPADGALIYCSDCTVANPCAGSGTGAFAKRLAGAWVCN